MRLPNRNLAGIAETPLGWIGLSVGPAGVRRVILPRPSGEEAEAELRGGEPTLDFSDQGALAPWLEPLQHALAGEPVDFSDWPRDWTSATPFQRRVWRATCQIPRGQTRTYWWVAVRAGDPRAVRAVGQALGANPLPLVVPCHRVVRTDGTLGGFTGGLEMKRRLLELEGVAPGEIARAA